MNQSPFYPGDVADLDYCVRVTLTDYPARDKTRSAIDGRKRYPAPYHVPEILLIEIPVLRNLRPLLHPPLPSVLECFEIIFYLGEKNNVQKRDPPVGPLVTSGLV